MEKKLDFLARKIGYIYVTKQDKDMTSIEWLCKVAFGLSFGIAINNLEWPWVADCGHVNYSNAIIFPWSRR